MYFGAISTDIKKSSTMWMNLPVWMKKMVKRTNNITEFVFENTKQEGIDQEQLPNSPEGDAFTFFYKGEDQDKLIAHVERVAQVLQRIYRLAREKNILFLPEDEIDEKIQVPDTCTKDEKKCKEAARELVKSKKFYHGIHVRVGVAFSDVPPIEYDYQVGDGAGTYKTYNSYWESVIQESERAERVAPYENGIGVTQPGAEVVSKDSTEKNSKYEVLIMLPENKEYMVDIAQMALEPECYDRERYTEALVKGYMIFVHYNLHIKWSDVERDAHLYQPLVNEFKQVHEDTKRTLEDSFPDKVELVKVKRSSDSMFYISEAASASDVWNKALKLTASLPTGSSMGICFTYKTEKLTQTTESEPFLGYNRKDYFGDVVNLAARMAGMDWCYSNGMFKVGKNDHKSRVAMCCADQKNRGWSDWFPDRVGSRSPGASSSNFISPIHLEDIPRSRLNAGTGVLRTISAHVYLGQTIHVGDDVEWLEGKTEYEGRVTKIDYLFANIKLKNGELCKGKNTCRKNITYLTKVAKDPLKQIAPMLPKKKNSVLKGGVIPLKF